MRSSTQHYSPAPAPPCELSWACMLFFHLSCFVAHSLPPKHIFLASQSQTVYFYKVVGNCHPSTLWSRTKSVHFLKYYSNFHSVTFPSARRRQKQQRQQHTLWLKLERSVFNRFPLRGCSQSKALVQQACCKKKRERKKKVIFVQIQCLYTNEAPLAVGRKSDRIKKNCR